MTVLIAACLLQFQHYDKLFTAEVVKDEGEFLLLSTAALQYSTNDVVEMIRVPKSDCVIRSYERKNLKPSFHKED